MEIYNITHGVDIDGMSSAAFLVHYYHMPTKNVFFAEHREDRFNEMLNDVKGMRARNGLIVVSDYAVQGHAVERLIPELLRLKKAGNKIVWLDHHPWYDADIKLLSRFCDIVVVGENKERCGAELVYRFLCPEDSFGKKLARFAHIADFALDADSKSQAQLIKEYALAIKYFNLLGRTQRMRMLRSTIEQLASGRYKNKLISKGYSDYSSISREETKKLLANTAVLRVGRIKMAIGFGSKLQSTSACLSIAKKFNPDISIYIDTHKQHPSAHLRSIKGVDCSKIAYAMGGGGHPQACAFQIRGGHNFSAASVREKFVRDLVKLGSGFY